MLPLDAVALKRPGGHASHWVCAVTEPATLVYLPWGHLVWAAQESVLRLPLDAKLLKYPNTHVWHTGGAILEEPATLVYLP